MQIVIGAVGRLRAGPLKSLFDDYARRLPWPLSVVEVQERRPLPEPVLKEREAALLLKAVPARAKVVALDERGRGLSSREFADMLAAWEADGAPAIAFLIGGAAGHGHAVRQAADLVLSLGPMTWPHLLVRPMLAEQLYRASCLLAGHPYHRD